MGDGTLSRAATRPIPSRTSTSPWGPGVVGAACALLLACPLVEAGAVELYHCIDAAGEQVFTDAPVQLEDCRLLEIEDSAAVETSPVRLPAPPQVPRGPEQIVGSEALDEDLDGAGDGVTVPVRRVGNLLIVPITVNGFRDAQLILDTGASHTILSPEIAGELGLLGDPTAQRVTLKTAGGPVQAEVVNVESLRIADAEVQNSPAAIYALPDSPPGIDGLLGLTFLKQFRVTLDTAQGLLHLSQQPGR